MPNGSYKYRGCTFVIVYNNVERLWEATCLELPGLKEKSSRYLSAFYKMEDRLEREYQHSKDKFPKPIVEQKVFTDMVMLGNGKYSEHWCNVLHAKLDYAISLVSGLQQLGCGPNAYGLDDYKKEEEKVKKDIKNILNEISIALGVD